MSDKFYHNDYKKLLNVDESKTASEKLLDKALKKHKLLVPDHRQDNQQRLPVKKVKLQPSQQQQLSPESVLKRVFNTFQKQRECIKISKALNVIDKCLQMKAFTQLMTVSQINKMLQNLLLIDIIATGSVNEIFKLIRQVRHTLQTICQHPLLLSQTKNTLKKEESQTQQQLLCYSRQQLDLKCQFYGLYTDDSFEFHNYLRTIKGKVFQVYEQMGNSQAHEIRQQSIESAQQRQALTTQFIELQILTKMISLPRNDTYIWIKTTIASFISQFLKNYRAHLHRPRQFLHAYNCMLAVKPGASRGSLGQLKDMMSRSTAGGTYTVIEQQDSSSTWCNKQ